jgi:hypothetical protein
MRFRGAKGSALDIGHISFLCGNQSGLSGVFYSLTVEWPDREVAGFVCEICTYDEID